MSIRMPAEHGAWGIVLVPLLSSALLAEGEWTPLLLMVTCVMGLFILRGSYERQAATRAGLSFDHAILAIAALGASAFLLFAYGRIQLLLIAAAAAGLFAMHHTLTAMHARAGAEKRSLPAELVGVLLLTLSAPAVWVAQRGQLDAIGLRVWLLNALFFAGGVLYVKYRVRGLLAHRAFHSLRERCEFAWPVLAYHLLLALFLATLVAAHSISALALAAFAPAILRATALLFQLGRSFPIKRLGWSEVGHALLFAVLLVVAMR